MAITQLNNYLPGQNLTNLADNVDYNRVGDDKTDISINHTTNPWTFTIKVGSLIEKDGNFYTVDTADYTLQATNNTHNYIVFTGTAFASSSSRGSYDAAKGGFYSSTNRVLKYFIDPDNDDEAEMLNESSILNVAGSIYTPVVYLTTTGTTSWTCPFTRYYDIEMVGRGGDGGDAQYIAGNSASAGGGSGAYGRTRIYIEKGDVWSTTFATGSGGNTTFSDGSTTLIIQNGYTGPSSTDSEAVGGRPGYTGSSLDYIFQGGAGHDGSTSRNKGGNGGVSFFAGGGNNYVQAALIGGGGGAGRIRTSVGTNTGGAGGDSLIIVK